MRKILGSIAAAVVLALGCGFAGVAIDYQINRHRESVPVVAPSAKPVPVQPALGRPGRAHAAGHTPKGHPYHHRNALGAGMPSSSGEWQGSPRREAGALSREPGKSRRQPGDDGADALNRGQL